MGCDVRWPEKYTVTAANLSITSVLDLIVAMLSNGDDDADFVPELCLRILDADVLADLQGWEVMASGVVVGCRFLLEQLSLLSGVRARFSQGSRGSWD